MKRKSKGDLAKMCGPLIGARVYMLSSEDMRGHPYAALIVEDLASIPPGQEDTFYRSPQTTQEMLCMSRPTYYRSIKYLSEKGVIRKKVLTKDAKGRKCHRKTYRISEKWRKKALAEYQAKKVATDVVKQAIDIVAEKKNSPAPIEGQVAEYLVNYDEEAIGLSLGELRKKNLFELISVYQASKGLNPEASGTIATQLVYQKLTLSDSGGEDNAKRRARKYLLGWLTGVFEFQYAKCKTELPRGGQKPDFWLTDAFGPTFEFLAQHEIPEQVYDAISPL